jgi:hypothetical protein
MLMRVHFPTPWYLTVPADVHTIQPAGTAVYQSDFPEDCFS